MEHSGDILTVRLNYSHSASRLPGVGRVAEMVVDPAATLQAENNVRMQIANRMRQEEGEDPL